MARTLIVISLGVFTLFLAAPYLCNCAVFTNKYALKISGGPEVAASLAARFGYVNLGQVGSLQDYYLFSHRRSRKRSVRSLGGPHTAVKNHPKVKWFEQQSELKRFKRQSKDKEEITIDTFTNSQANMKLIKNLGRPARPQYFNQDKIFELHDQMFPEGDNDSFSSNDNITVKKIEAAEKEQENEIYFNDPEWNNLWYLNSEDGINMNVIPAWKRNYTGKGVVITILDDGLDYNHPELKDSYDSSASYDINGDDYDPFPRFTVNNDNRHGTRCAGEIVMKPNNGICGVGIAYDAKIGGIRMLDGRVTDYVEAFSLSFGLHHIDIYSSSWGPSDDGATFDRPRRMTIDAILMGIQSGRDSKGVIYIWASGNGGSALDDCNADGYINSIYTIAIGSTNERGTRPWYQESCASTLASTYSSGSIDDRQVVTTDLHDGCTTKHTGTSASAPLAAGICALALEANPELTWRDMQHLIVLTSKKGNLQAPDWVTNGAGLQVSHVFGFGLMDADAMVRLAEVWTTVPEQHVCQMEAPMGRTGRIRIEAEGVTRVRLLSNGCKRQENMVNYLEHVHAVVTLIHPIRGELQLTLISPAGTPSTLLSHRPHDHSRYGLFKWSFLTTHSWGEDPYGTWTLEISNPGQHPGMLWNLTLVLYGTEYPVIHHQYARASLNDPDACSKDYPECHEQCCGDCDDDTPKGCWKCKSYRDRVSGKCVEKCPAGQYPYALHHQCHWCDDSCKTCYGPNTDNCFSCAKDDHFLVEDTNTCMERCPVTGYYTDQEKRFCRLCRLSYCEDCKDANTCTRCAPNTVLNQLSKQCEIHCPLTTYRDEDECKACTSGCSKCYGPETNQCLACAKDHLLFGTDCRQKEECGEGWYPSDSSTCFSCTHFCKSCDGPYSQDCQECEDGYTKDDDDNCMPGCGQGKYHDVDSGECQSCPDHCTTCSSKDTCAKCHSGYLLKDGNQCAASCSEGEFEENGACTSCHSDCKTCRGDSANDCVTCNGDKLVFGGVCITQCFPGFYEDPGRQECLECHISCEECRDEAKKCTKCYEEDTLDKNRNRCVPTGSDPDDLCQVANCTRCDSYPDECTECDDDHYLVDSWHTCVEECPGGTYPDSDSKACGKCHSSCTTCTGSTSRDCQSCTEPYFLHGGECRQMCPDGTFEDFDEDSCIDCSKNCLTCYGNGETQCLSCKSDYFLNYIGRCVHARECEDYQYADTTTGQCESCDIDCLECNGPSNDHCTSCWNGYSLKNKKCVVGTSSTCEEGKFVDSRGECQDCHWTCQSCNGPQDTDCTRCNDEMYIGGNDKRCVLYCPGGTYPDTDSWRCEQCHETCQSCNGPEKNDCNSCKEELYLHDDKECVQECPARTFNDWGSMICYPCSPECLTCINTPYQCTSCPQSLFLLDGSCHQDCPTKYSKDQSLQICKPLSNCPPHCHSCDATFWCLDCEDGYNEWLGDCVAGQRDQCKDGEFMSDDDMSDDDDSCQRCDETCKTCWGADPQDCLSCDSDKVLQQGYCSEGCPTNQYEDKESNSCQVCHPTCKNCVGGQVDQCTQCKDGLVLAIPYDSSGEKEIGYCESYCPNGYFDDKSQSNKCVPCHDSCLTCIDAGENSCLSCKAIYVLYTREEGDSRCLNECPRGSYSHVVRDKNGYASYDCHPCHYNCKECYGKMSTQCYSCKEGTFFKDNECVSSCGPGLYTDGDRCGHCSKDCANCVGPAQSDCIQCAGNLKLKMEPFTRKISCTANCGTTFFSNSVNSCQRCHMSCQECDGPLPRNCTACREGFTLDPNSHICYPLCTSGQYPVKSTTTDSGVQQKDEDDEKYEYVDLPAGDDPSKSDDVDVECGQCHRTCKECTDKGMKDCYMCQQFFVFHPSGVCAPCCEKHPDLPFCCNCHAPYGECRGDLDEYIASGASGLPPPATNHSGSQHTFYLAGLVAAICVIVFILFFVIFGILQARSKKQCCWRHPYQKIPMYYEAENNKVSVNHDYASVPDDYASVPDDYRDERDEDDIYVQD